MKKTLAGMVIVVALSAPVAAFADTGTIIALYQQLIQLLRQELMILTNKTLPTGLEISPQSGSAPLTVTYSLKGAKDNEAIDFGDGHSSGSSGCIKNALGHCDLSQPITHTYQLPGEYKVSLLRTVDSKTQTISTSVVKVTK